jgi:peptide/nickel transport system substrate-binding protein
MKRLWPLVIPLAAVFLFVFAAPWACRPTIPAAPSSVERFGPAPRDSYNPKIGRRGGQMVLSSFGEGLKSFNPITAGETSTSDYTDGIIFEGLGHGDPWTQEVKPWLAESWEHSDDFLVWTFQLRRDVRFNNGMPMTADDVVFSFDIIYDEKITSSSRDLLTVEGRRWQVEKVDDYSVRITLPTQYAIFLEIATSGGIVPILCKKVCEPPYKAGTFNSFMGAESTPQEVVGTGPFMLERYIPGQRLTLKRNPHYWVRDAVGNQLPYLDRMLVLWVQTLDAMMLQFQAGEVDGYQVRGIDYPILKPMEQQGNFRIYELGPRMGSAFICLNQNPDHHPETGKPYVEPHKRKWFSDTRFRQAIAHCIDREGIIKTVHNGLGLPIYGPMNKGVGYFYNDRVKPYEYNLERARRLLSDMGLQDRNRDGLLEDEAGNVVQFTLMTNAGNNLREQTAEILRKDLARLGIKVDLKFIEFNLLISKMDETFDWEALVMGLTGGTEPHSGSNVWKSSGRLHMWYPRQKTPATPWEARIDKIFAAGIKEMDRAKRKELYDEWQMIVNEQQPFVYTVADMDMYAWRNRFENVYPTVLAGAGRRWTYWNLHEIFVKEGHPLQ